MKIESYPVFLIYIISDYATISTPESDQEHLEYGLMVFSTRENAEDLVKKSDLHQAEVVELNAEELAEVWGRMVAPVTKIAWDTKLDDEGNLTTYIADSLEQE